jgi:crenactin
MTTVENYRSHYTFAMDFGTSDFKFGPITCGDTPRIVNNRGYFPDKGSVIYRAFESTPDVVVGDEIPLYLQSSEDLSTRLVYPMRNGVIEKGDNNAWRVVSALSAFGLNSFKPEPNNGFQGFYLVASLSSVSPRYMYEQLLEIIRQNNENGFVRSVTVIPQPFAVAIGHGVTTCVVLESGHGNSQICPISKYPIRAAQVALNRGGGDANAITSEILKDAGYADLANEEALIRKVKESIALVPADLETALQEARKAPRKFRAKYKVPGTRVEIDLGKDSWTRFLIGEYVFNPNHEIFERYYSRGMQRPKDVKMGDTTFRGMLDFGDAIIASVERCPVELQPLLYREILLSGGNFSWSVPERLEGVAVDAPTKIKLLLRDKGIRNVSVKMTQSPQFSVWHGCIIYGFAVPDEYEWDWQRLEGWMKLGDQSSN